MAHSRNNTLYGEGGAIYNFIKVTELDPFNYQIVGMLNVTDSKLLNNNATFGGAIYNLCSEKKKKKKKKKRRGFYVTSEQYLCCKC